MANKQEYEIGYDRTIPQQLAYVAKKYHSLMENAIYEQLRREPTVETKNRKPLKAPIFGAAWELRLGPKNCFRVFYDVNENTRQVIVLAVGVKDRERLTIGGQEVRQ